MTFPSSDRPASQIYQRIPGHAVDSPVRHRLRAQRNVEVDRGLIPVQYQPFKPATAPLDGKPREKREQALAVAPN